MKIINSIYLILALLLATGCSNVKVALYDHDKRQEVAIETRKAFSNTEAGREMAIKNSMIETAKSLVGTRYKYASTDPKQGFDCSGLVYYCAKKQKIELPRSSRALAASAPHISWKKAGPGDLVFFGYGGRIDHVAIVERNKEGELWVVHSTNQRGVYEENVLVSSYWKKRVLFAVDFTELCAALEKVKS